MAELTLLRRQSSLAKAKEQVRTLESIECVDRFPDVLSAHRLAPLRATGIDVLQLNVGKLCNQTCSHCHVDAGPDRRESMSSEVAAACIDVLRRTQISTLDITGGAPEMNPQFRWLVEEASLLKRRVIDRCNLTILVAPGFDDLPEFLAKHQVEVVASLPCYLEENVDKQRGDHVFRRSIEALQRLNQCGYGLPDSPLTLTLVFNPLGPSLPPDQQQLEAAYRRELRSRYGVEFNRIFTITNMPISRFLDDLLQRGQLEAYLEKLVTAFNPDTIDGLMCRSMLSVDWEGRLYDCDFNQMLDLQLTTSNSHSVFELSDELLANLVARKINTGKHCFGCTAGAGSSCQGAVVGGVEG